MVLTQEKKQSQEMTREKSDLGVIFIFYFFTLDQAILEAKTMLQELSVL